MTNSGNDLAERKMSHGRPMCDRRSGIMEWKLHWNGNYHRKAKRERREENTKKELCGFHDDVTSNSFTVRNFGLLLDSPGGWHT